MAAKLHGVSTGKPISADSDRAERRTRILHVVHGLARGGLENGVVNLLNHLPDTEFEQAVCCLENRGEMAERIRIPIPIRELHRNGYDLRIPFQLAKVIRQWRPDVVHARNWTAWLDAFAANYIAGRRPALVWSFHGFSESENFPMRRRLASRLLARGTDHLLAVCRDSAHRYAAATGIDERRFEVIYNGVDCVRFRPSGNTAGLRRALGIPGDAAVVLTVASLTPVKDHIALARAAARVTPASPVLFLLLGEGPERARLEAEICRLGLGRRVLLLGDSDRIPDYLAASDLFVLPSRLEGMSNSILEGMSSGLPVVANRVGGNPELVEHGVTGFLCRQGDPDDMADAISRLVADESLRRRMGTAARAHATQRFSMEAMANAYGEFYKRAASLRKGSARMGAES